MASVLLRCLHRPQALLIGSAPGCADLASPRLPHIVFAALADRRSWQVGDCGGDIPCCWGVQSRLEGPRGNGNGAVVPPCDRLQQAWRGMVKEW